MKAKILVVDDRLSVAKSLAERLEGEGYEAITAIDYEEAYYHFEEDQPDLVILDIDFAGSNIDRTGLDILKRIRSSPSGTATPVIMWTGVELGQKDLDRLEVRAFHLEATDFVPKSVSTRVLLARIEAKLPRAMRKTIVVDDFIRIDLERNSVKVRTENAWHPVHLEPKESQILAKLVKNPGRVIMREVLEGFFENADDPARTLNSYISKLRKELEPNPCTPQYILTKRGVGYWFVDYR